MVIVILTILLIAVGSGAALAIGIACNTSSDLKNAMQIVEDRDELIEDLRTQLEVSGPTCLCEHGINFHLEGGRCVSDTGTRETWFTSDAPIKCKCLRYTGPEPLPSFYHPLELKT